jgi:hypothetical protein
VEEQDPPASQKPGEALHLLAVDDIHPQRLVRGILGRAHILHLLVLLKQNSGQRVERFNCQIALLNKRSVICFGCRLSRSG